MGNNQIKPNKNIRQIPLKKYKKLHTILKDIENEFEQHNHRPEIIEDSIQQLIISEQVNQINKRGETFLLWAIGNFSGHFLFKIVRRLLMSGANPNQVGNLYLREELYNNPNQVNVENGRKDVVKHQSTVIYKNVTPLFAVTRQIGNQFTGAILELMICYNARLSFKFPNFIRFFRFNNQYDLRTLKILVRQGLDITSLCSVYSPYYKRYLYNTPIMLVNCASMTYAPKELKFEVLKYMIDSGNDLSFETNTKTNFWHTFKDEDYSVKSEVIKYLKTKKSNNRLFISKECLICFESDKQLCLTHCHHAVCCLDCYVEMNNSKCPYCNQELITNQYQLVKFISD